MNKHVVLLGLAMLVGCGGTELPPSDLTIASSAALSVESANQAGGLVAFIADGLPATTTTAPEAATAASQLTSVFTPSGCATATSKLNATTYTFANCSGPYGLVKLSGTVVATFKPSGQSGLDIEITSTALTVGKSSLDLNATATWQKGSTSDTLIVASSSSGTNTRGGMITHMGMYSVTWDTQCLDLDGTFSTTIGALTWQTTVSGYKRCGGQCPAADGMVTVVGPSNRSVTIAYSGGGTAFATTSTGQTGMVTLPCAD